MTLITSNLRFEACRSKLKVNRGDFCVIGIAGNILEVARNYENQLQFLKIYLGTF